MSFETVLISETNVFLTGNTINLVIHVESVDFILNISVYYLLKLLLFHLTQRLHFYFINLITNIADLVCDITNVTPHL